MNGIVLRARGAHAKKDVVRGLALIAGGVFLYFFWQLYVVLLLLLLAFWFLSSAAVALLPIVRTRGKLMQGFLFALGLAIASLLMGYWAFVDPARLGKILVLVLGVIMLLAGAFLFIDGYGMRNAAKLIEGQELKGTLSATT